MRAAVKSGKLHRSDLENENETVSFFKGLISDITKQNATWGNFLPFKKLVVNDRAYDFLRRGELDFATKNAQLSKLLSNRARKFDELTAIMPRFSNIPMFYRADAGGTTNLPTDSPKLTAVQALSSEIIKLDARIEQLRDSFFSQTQQRINLQSEEGTLRIFGNDISYDESLTNQGSGNQNQKIIARMEFRKKLNQLTQRRFWKTKANEDPNLFIVNDQYDKNYDIQAFSTQLSGQMKLFESTFTNVFERVQAVSQILGLEVFADSQGHIHARPPQYNRMPSSVFRNMIQTAAEKGIRVFPRFLESLFYNQASGIAEQLEILEDQIRIRAAALGATNDVSAKTFIGGDFEFVTRVHNESNTANVGNKDLRFLFDQNNPDILEQRSSKTLNAIAKHIRASISSSLSSKLSFDITKRTEIVLDERSFSGSDNDINSAISKIGERLKRKTGVPAPTRRMLLSNDRIIEQAGRLQIANSQADVLKVTNEIAQFVAERQQLIKLLANSLKNLQEGLSINDEQSSSAQNILIPQLNRGDDKILPEVIEHMIEDEDVDDFGIGSGQRYILTDAKIISLQISEKPPPFTIAQVDGKLAGGITALPSGLEVGNGGNLMGTAWAVDYDMWRMYGFKAPHPVNMPIFQNPRTQCAPYAVFLLNRARKNIFQANASVVGNEYIQAGEVYYVEDRDLLFYADSVTHQFAYNQGFTTQLNLTYGHNPGEYIPTELDIMGKGMYANRHQANLVRHDRAERADDSTHVGTLIWDASQISEGGPNISDLVNGQFAEINKQTMYNIMLATAGLITPTTFGKQLGVEVRTYFNSNAKNKIMYNTNLVNIASTVKDWLVRPQAFSASKEILLPDDIEDESDRIPEDLVKVLTIDLNEDLDEERSPSGSAWNAARSLARSGTNAAAYAQLSSAAESAEGQANESSAFGAMLDGINQTKLNIELGALGNQVIDVWVTFSDAEEVIEGSNSTEPGWNQAAQIRAAKADKAFREKLDTDYKVLQLAESLGENSE
jgi:hypothetical protein